ncbi:hypothetical protein [Streptomyces fulvoviolaceus]|uniref:hypothetical protein n=1 Tax=Streptomyces fulvoviolaceus TaxID=285535 RepID=UPI0021C08CE5|nr:hypothetical protein [Streptomyces fulvoviolaceus]MCT9075510.1 hypothetical protein [Streptomyces fulvoviolaceus]
MAGRDFGHHLGLPRALSGLPLSPLVPGYGALVAAQHSAGLRHVGEALAPAGVGLAVLDGLYVPSGARGRRRVDEALLNDLSRAATPSGTVAGLLADACRRDPQAPRRIVLYQLIGLLQDRPAAERPSAAAELGVQPAEAAGLVAAARLRPALDRRQRDAAESLADAWKRHRLHRVRALLEQLPKSGRDQDLETLRATLAARLAVVDAALKAAREADGRRDAKAASEEYLRALHEAADDRRALRGLVRVHGPRGGRPALLHAELAWEQVELSWQDTEAEEDHDWRLLCLFRDAKGAARVREVALDSTGLTARDTAVALGSTVRYAALPVRDGRATGPPLVSHRVLVAPDVTGLTLADGPRRVAGSWQQPPGAADVTVECTGPEGTTGQLRPGTGGFTATDLPVGSHAFRVVCHYRAPGGALVLSPGVRATRTVHPWPEPVRTLTARADGEALRVDWTGAQGAEVRLVRWPGEAPAPGTELRTDELPPRLDEGGGLLRPPAGSLRLASVAVLGERALTGPAVDVETLSPVTGLAARRLPDGQAEITLDWPDGAGHLSVAWELLDLSEGGSTGGERTVTAHAFRRGGLRLPVGPRGVRIRAAGAPRSPDAVVIPATTADVVLPPDAAIDYRLVRPPRKFFGRGGGPTVLRVTLSAPGGHPSVPEFVCVARSGTLRPRSATDGTTVLRIPGTDLTRHGMVEQELPAAPCPAPYTLRGFLLGEHAAAVRLEEPSPATLVVR